MKPLYIFDLDGSRTMFDACRLGHASRDAEVEALRKDAERYRWLRDNGISQSWCVSQDASSGGVYQYDSTGLGGAIDAAMAKESGE